MLEIKKEKRKMLRINKGEKPIRSNGNLTEKLICKNGQWIKLITETVKSFN